MMSKIKEVIYTCGVCKEKGEMDFDHMMDHLEKVHDEVVKNKQVTREMISHMDGAKFFTYEFKYTTQSGLVFFQHLYFERGK